MWAYTNESGVWCRKCSLGLGFLLVEQNYKEVYAKYFAAVIERRCGRCGESRDIEMHLRSHPLPSTAALYLNKLRTGDGT